MPITRDPELEAFKTGIDLRAYATGLGYELDRRESWRGSAVMRGPGDDKVIIKRDTDGHYVYFSVRDEADNGSLIDFAMRRKRLSLGQVRKELRPWAGKRAAALPSFPALPVTGKDRLAVETAFRRMAIAERHPYLETVRGLPAALLTSPRFRDRIRVDALGNAVFPHFDERGLCGYEIKNAGFTGFARGGRKGLWCSHGETTDTHLVICESAIDALSYAALFPSPTARYASLGGQVNARQHELLAAALKRLPHAFQVVAAMDADPTGQSLSRVVSDALAWVVIHDEREDLQFSEHPPADAKDWNDALRYTRSPSFPTAPNLET